MARDRDHIKQVHQAVDGMVNAMKGLLATLGATGPTLPPEMKHPVARPKPRGRAKRSKR